MIGLWLRLIAVFILLTCAIIAAARLQPYDDGGLRETLFSPDCQPPCFMGTRPGITTCNQALQLLQANPWVAQATTPDDRIEWTWNRRQPTFLQVPLEDSRILLKDGVVSWIGIETSVQLGDIKIIFNAPDATYYGTGKDRDSQGDYTYFGESVVYSGHQLEATIYTHCPLTVKTMWQQSVMISLPARPDFIPNLRNRFAPVPKACQ